MKPTEEQCATLLGDYRRLAAVGKKELLRAKAGFRSHRVIGFTYYNWNNTIVYDDSCVGGN